MLIRITRVLWTLIVTSLVAPAFVRAALPAPRHGTVGTDVFLGGDYIELGMSRGGSFGSQSSKPAGFYGSSGDTKIGLVLDYDGFGVGVDSRPDFFLPGTPFEGWSLGTDVFCTLTNQGLNLLTSTSVVDTTDPADASGVLRLEYRATVYGNLQLVHKLTFPPHGLYFTNDLSITNIGSTTYPALKYGRLMDPDQGSFVGGSTTTINKVIARYDTQGYSSVLATPTTPVGFTDTFVYYSKDPNAMVAAFPGFSGTANQVFTANQPVGTSIKADAWIGIAWNLGDVTPGATVKFSFASSLTTDPNSIISFLSGCGDGSKTDAEQCDDGNNNNGDGCSSSCQIESGFYPPSDKTNVVAACYSPSGLANCDYYSCTSPAAADVYCVTCSANYFLASDGTCYQPTCPGLSGAYVSHATVTGTCGVGKFTTPASTCSVACDSGYYATGTATLTCSLDASAGAGTMRTASYKTPSFTCTPSSCAALSLGAGSNTVFVGTGTCPSGGSFTASTSCTVGCADGYHSSGAGPTAVYVCSVDAGASTASYKTAAAISCIASQCVVPSLTPVTTFVGACSTGVFTPSASQCTIACADGYADYTRANIVTTCSIDNGASTASYKSPYALNCLATTCDVPTLNPALHQVFIGACGIGNFISTPSQCTVGCDFGYHDETRTSITYTCSPDFGVGASYKTLDSLKCTAARCAAPKLEAHTTFVGACNTGDWTPSASTCAIGCALGYADEAKASITTTCTLNKDGYSTYNPSGALNCQPVCLRPSFTAAPAKGDIDPSIKHYAAVTVEAELCSNKGHLGDTCRVTMKCPYLFSLPEEASYTQDLPCVAQEDGTLAYQWTEEAQGRGCYFNGMPRNGSHSRRRRGN